LLGDITMCTLLGVRPVLVVSLEQRLLERIAAEGLLDGPRPLDCLPADPSILRVAKEEAGALTAELEGILSRLGATSQGRRRAAGPAMDTDMHSCSVYSSSQLFSTVPQKARDSSEEGLLGKVFKVDDAQINRRLLDNDMVCMAPLGMGSGGDVRCVSSEDLAAEVAKQLQAAKLIFFTKGQRIVDLRRRQHVISAIQIKDATSFVQHATASKRFAGDDHAQEILVYLGLLIDALAHGTRRGHLIDATQGALLQELYTTDGRGTLVSQDLYDGIRLADSSDVAGILEVIEPLVRKKLLRRRSGYEVESSCRRREMFVWKRDDTTLGCASLQCFDDSPDIAELGCFVVSPECRGRGHGTVLLAYIERVAVLQGLSSLFLLTTQTMQWFVERGFREASLEELPKSKQQSYDMGRSSKIYVKRLDSLPSEVMERFSFVEVDTLD